MSYLLRSNLMGNLNSEFNISLAKADYFHLRVCCCSKNKIIEEKYIAFVFREVWEHPNGQIFTRAYYKNMFRGISWGHYFIFAESSQWDYLSDIIQFRLKWTDFDKHSRSLVTLVLCGRFFITIAENLYLANWLINILYPSFSLWNHLIL